MIASARGFNTIVEKLVRQYTASINKVNDCNQTALMFAAMYGHHDAVKLLMKGLNADNTSSMILAKNKHGKTALTFATMYGHKDIVNTLSGLNADSKQRSLPQQLQRSSSRQGARMTQFEVMFVFPLQLRLVRINSVLVYK